MYIIIAIIVFGVLITVHELGHFISAKLMGVKVNEFAIGMGPPIFKRQKGETAYSLRVLPIGGFCAMEGEDTDTGDPRAFTSKGVWPRFVILVAGSLMNFITGLLIILIIFSQAGGFYSTAIDSFMDGFPLQGEDGLLPGDRILEIDGENIYAYSDISLFLSRGDGTSYDLVIERDGRKITLDDFPLSQEEYVYEGQMVTKFGMIFGIEEATPGTVLKETWYNAIDFVRLVRVSLVDLVSGSAGMNDLSGPIGIVDIMNDVGEQSEDTAAAITNIAYLGAFIAINLAVLNLLPLPALDGGRIFFMFITWIIERIIRRRLDPKYEGYIHTAGFAFFMALMVFVAYNDIAKLVVN